ncbi:efflux RND transporter periplasmic adaptor subunit [Rhodohalobacter mucosus]|uniref:Efflux transporter periplasmic adaptor subunit n=1 Tax=Rhodohalobacter mucosus TaxID=2079485 RepID=A0A316TWV2_9BACT|nr:efflux RND transporter periplasmic adaptor subunit [Rhodohalobacter mucosus]PWN07735.1 efflux transporter periplasmic adaptor subunit [Rhodohalobacter mucosus]
MSKVGKRTLIITLVLVVIGALSYPKITSLFGEDAGPGSPQGSFGNSAALQVEAVELEPESIQDRIFTSGSVEANESVELSFDATGIVTRIFFDEGSRVRRGQLLVKVNDSELQAQLQRASFRLNLAEQREERQRRLLERGGISQDEYDATLNEVNVLRSEMRLINAQIAKTEIRAPFSGIVGLKYVSPGSYVSPSTRIASLQEIDPVKINFSVPERYLSKISVDDQILFDVQGVDSTFTGRVYAVEPRINTQTRTLQVRAISENDDELLYPGAFANIELILEQIDDALMIPTIAIMPELNRQKVYLVRDGVVEQAFINTGIRTSNKAQVLSGLERGDTVLTTGLLQVRPGMEVEISELTKSSEL